VSYTVWSRERLVGESDLGYVRWNARFRSGDFFPTPFGETVIALMMESSIALTELEKVMREYPTGEMDLNDPRWRTANADIEAAENRSEALALELRDANGAVIPTEYVSIRDTYLILQMSEEREALNERHADIFGEEMLDPELEADIEHDLALFESDDFFDDFDSEPWRPDGEPELPRYQIHVSLLHEGAIP
jgi:hypothetical protein